MNAHSSSLPPTVPSPPRPRHARSLGASVPLDDETLLARKLERAPFEAMQAEYFRQGELLILPDFIPAPIIAQCQREAEAATKFVTRLRVLGYRRGGAASRHVLEREAPAVTALYRSPALRSFLSKLIDVPLLLAPEEDPHGCALYTYTRPGDRVGFHYDTSFYRGARYTVLIGLHDDSSARLHCRLHTRTPHRQIVELKVATRPGTVVIFDGDKLHHCVTPLGVGERRIVLSLQYVTRQDMGSLQRAVSNLKDAMAYFGFAEFLRWFRPRARALPPGAGAQ